MLVAVQVIQEKDQRLLVVLVVEAIVVSLLPHYLLSMVYLKPVAVVEVVPELMVVVVS